MQVVVLLTLALTMPLPPLKLLFIDATGCLVGVGEVGLELLLSVPMAGPLTLELLLVSEGVPGRLAVSHGDGDRDDGRISLGISILMVGIEVGDVVTGDFMVTSEGGGVVGLVVPMFLLTLALALFAVVMLFVVEALFRVGMRLRVGNDDVVVVARSAVGGDGTVFAVGGPATTDEVGVGLIASSCDNCACTCGMSDISDLCFISAPDAGLSPVAAEMAPVMGHAADPEELLAPTSFSTTAAACGSAIGDLGRSAFTSSDDSVDD